MSTDLKLLFRNTHVQLNNLTAPLANGRKRCSDLHAQESICGRLTYLCRVGVSDHCPRD